MGSQGLKAVLVVLVLMMVAPMATANVVAKTRHDISVMKAKRIQVTSRMINLEKEAENIYYTSKCGTGYSGCLSKLHAMVKTANRLRDEVENMSIMIAAEQSTIGKSANLTRNLKIVNRVLKESIHASAYIRKCVEIALSRSERKLIGENSKKKIKAATKWVIDGYAGIEQIKKVKSVNELNSCIKHRWNMGRNADSRLLCQPNYKRISTTKLEIMRLGNIKNSQVKKVARMYLLHKQLGACTSTFGQ